MFDKLKFKIGSLVILTFSLCFIIMGVISYSVIRTVIYDNFIDFSVKNINQKINNIKIYSKFIEETSKQVTANPDTIRILKHQESLLNIVYLLDSVKQSHLGVLGVALFDTSGTTYLSNYTTAYPPLSKLLNNEVVSKLLASGQASFWSVRTQDISGYYNNTRYAEEYGVITFVSKIFDDTNNLRGYLFIDIDPQYAYSFFNSSDRAFPNHTSAYIVNPESGILPSKLNLPPTAELLYEINGSMNITNSYKIAASKKYILACNDFFNNNKIIVVVPLADLYTKLNQMIIIMLSVIVVLIFLSTVTALLLTNSISVPLTDLYKRMRNNSV